MALLENVFSWSKSRDEEFRECQRKYFYARYLSWGGWDKNAPKEIRLAYILKNIKNRWAWKGERVHHTIEAVLKSMRAGRPQNLEEALTSLTGVMRRDYLASKGKKYFEDPKNNLGLFEHEYEKQISDDVWKKIHDEAAVCVKNFYASAFYQELLKDPKENWLVIEDLEEFSFSTGVGPASGGDGSKIYVKLDFARQKDGVVEIYDWKTGKNESEASVQMGAYAIYAMQKWKIPLSQVRAYLFYIANDSAIPQSYPLSENLIEEARKTMSSSIQTMKELLSDPTKNIPKPRENFPFTSNERLCSSCNFYKICEKYHS